MGLRDSTQWEMSSAPSVLAGKQLLKPLRRQVRVAGFGSLRIARAAVCGVWLMRQFALQLT
jgi:hypothetical protein